MPVVNGRLTCCRCGADLGDAEDPYRDPSCMECENREARAEAEAEDDRARWNDEDVGVEDEEPQTDYERQREAMRDAEQSAYYGDLGVAQLAALVLGATDPQSLDHPLREGDYRHARTMLTAAVFALAATIVGEEESR